MKEKEKKEKRGRQEGRGTKKRKKGACVRVYVRRVFVCAVIRDTSRRNSDAAISLCLLHSRLLMSLVVVLDHKTLLPSSCHLQTEEQGEVRRHFFQLMPSVWLEVCLVLLPVLVLFLKSKGVQRSKRNEIIVQHALPQPTTTSCWHRKTATKPFCINTSDHHLSSPNKNKQRVQEIWYRLPMSERLSICPLAVHSTPHDAKQKKHRVNCQTGLLRVQL